MVSQSDIMTIQMLNADLMQIQRALRLFDENGVITSVTISGRMIPFEQATIQTADMLYPPQMVDAIKEALIARRQVVYEQLKTLGVTDIDMSAQAAGPRMAAMATASAPEQPKPRRRR